MNRRETLAALSGALLGAGALHIYLQRYEHELLGDAPVAVVMTTRDVALGDELTRSALDVRELPERYVEERHILAADLERVLGARATSSVASGSSLLWSDLDVLQERRSLSSLVRSGMRAFTLPQPDVSLKGWLRPGDRVDVLFTASATATDTVTLLERALVLTVGDDSGDVTARGAAHPRDIDRVTTSVTLSVTIEQAQLLAQSERRGTLRLALRNPQDFAVAAGTTASSDAQLSQAGEKPAGSER